MSIRHNQVNSSPRNVSASVDILVVTPTLGSRSSVSQTIETVQLVGGSRVFHCIVGPLARIMWIQSMYPHIHLLDDRGCNGIYSALNFAISSFSQKYQYFAYINDDDYWLPGFKELVSRLDTSSSLSLIYGRTRFVTSNGRYIKTISSFPYPRCFKSLMKFNVPIFTQQSVLCRLSDLIELGGFDEMYRILADSELFLRWIESGRKVASASVVCSCYCFEGDRLSNDRSSASSDLVRLQGMHALTISLSDLLVLMAFRLYNTLGYLSNVFRIFLFLPLSKLLMNLR